MEVGRVNQGVAAARPAPRWEAAGLAGLSSSGCQTRPRKAKKVARAVMAVIVRANMTDRIGGASLRLRVLPTSKRPRVTPLAAGGSLCQQVRSRPQEQQAHRGRLGGGGG